MLLKRDESVLRPGSIACVMAGITGVVVVIVEAIVIIVVDIDIAKTTTTTTTTNTTTTTTCEKSFNNARSNLVGTGFSAEEFVKICSATVNQFLRAENKIILNSSKPL